MEIALLPRATIPAPQISWFTDRHRRTVGRWVVRVEGGDPVTDRPRSGRPALFSEETQLRQRVLLSDSCVAGVHEVDAQGRGAALRRQSEDDRIPMSRPTIARVLAKHALRPHLRKYFLQITDPEFFPKMDHLIGLYTDPPEHLFCFDECTGVQALERLTPTLPATIGHLLAKEFEYRRHGTTDVIAFLKPSTGDVFCRCTQNHTAQTLIRVFTEHVERQPKDAPLHYICDNLSTHFKDEFCATVAALSGVGYTPLKTGIERRVWLQSEEKRIALHFTPFHRIVAEHGGNLVRHSGKQVPQGRIVCIA